MRAQPLRFGPFTELTNHNEQGTVPTYQVICFEVEGVQFRLSFDISVQQMHIRLGLSIDP